MLHFMTLYAIRDMDTLKFRNDGLHPRMVHRPENATLYVREAAAAEAAMRLGVPGRHWVRGVFGLSSWKDQALP